MYITQILGFKWKIGQSPYKSVVELEENLQAKYYAFSTDDNT